MNGVEEILEILTDYTSFGAEGLAEDLITCAQEIGKFCCFFWNLFF